MEFVGVFLGALGMIALLSGKSTLQALIGMQLLFIGVVLLLVQITAFENLKLQVNCIGIILQLVSVPQLVLGFSLSMRQFIMQKNWEPKS